MADTFIWHELMTTDVAAAKAFYAPVAGWTMSEQGPPGTPYTVACAGAQGVAGIATLAAAAGDAGARPGWIGYIGVDDTDATARRIAEGGGHVLRAPADIPDVGRFAVVADPGGAVFNLLAPLPRAQAPAPAPPGTPGTFGWSELYSGNGQEAAFGFYSELFGWATLEDMDMGAMGHYRIFGLDGVQLGGMMDKPAHLPVAGWGFYINVDGIDAAIARIAAHGGTVLVGPHQVPGGSWIVQAADPQGAQFALVSQRR